MKRLLVALMVVGLPQVAWALPVKLQVPTNAVISHAGLEWAWAAPCAPTEPSCGVIDLSFQSGFGWRLPTAPELLLHPVSTDFQFPGANVPLGGSDPNGAHFQAQTASLTGDAACAAPYFSTAHSHCDWSDGSADFWAGLPGSDPLWETLVVRGDADLSPVPEPATLLLFGSSLAALAGAGWRRRRQ